MPKASISFTPSAPVKIISRYPLPPPPKLSVALHYKSSDEYLAKKVIASQAVRVDELVISSVNGIIGPRPTPVIAFNGLKNGARWIYHNGRFTILEKFVKPTLIEHPVCDTRNVEPNNIAHLLINVIPYCIYVQTVVDVNTVFVFGKMWPLFKEIVQLFGIDPHCDCRRLEANVIQLFGRRGLAAYDLIGMDEVWASSLLPDIYSKFNFPVKRKREKTFLARRGLRGLQNQIAVCALLEKFGYQTIYMEDYPLEEQCSIAANAVHVVAVHGAAMAFLVLAHKIKSVIELMPNHNYKEYFPVALGERVNHYEQIISTFEETEGHLGYASLVKHMSVSFEVDLTILTDRLKIINP